MKPPAKRRFFCRIALISVAGAAALFLLATAVLAGVGLCDHPAVSDAGLVLGNEVESDGHASARLEARLDAALRLRHLGYFDTVMVSGGIGPAGQDEATTMRDYLLAHGVLADSIIVDREGNNTYASARNTVRTMRAHGWNHVLVVAQYFHVPRARLALGHFGAHDVSSGSARHFEWRDLYSLPRETIAYAWYALRHYDRISGRDASPQ